MRSLLHVFSRFAKPLALGLLLAGVAATAAESREQIDLDRLRELFRRRQAGETLSREEQDYLERGRREMQARKSGKAASPAAKNNSNNKPVADPAMVRALVPLDELSGTYKSADGGLYGGGRNAPTGEHLAAYLREAKTVQPLDAQGKAAKSGKIVMLSLGMSNTTMEFSQFVKTANADPAKSPSVVLVDGAMGGRTATVWALDGVALLPEGEEERLQKLMADTGRNAKRSPGDTWSTVETRLHAAGVTAQQVQVLWLKQAEAMPARLGDYPAHVHALEANLVSMLNIARQRYPNLRIAYLSSRIFGGYATTALNPEPYAYEGAFAVRGVIQRQIAGEPRLNYAAARGDVKAPLVVWGPYLWANGATPRRSDGLSWHPDDFAPNDRTHPAPSGRQKVADLLLRFFKTDPGARLWFTGSAKE